MIYNLQIHAETLSWAKDDQFITARLDGKVEQAIVLSDGSGIAAVFSPAELSRDNAIVLNANGEIRFQLRNPFPSSSDVIFYYFHYSSGRLIAALAGAGSDYACEVNESTGECGPVHDSR